MKEKVIFNWSGGKDSALCLHKIQQEYQYDIICLLTGISEPYKRISMHGVREDLLDMQAESTGLSLQKIRFSGTPGMETYEKVMTTALSDLISKGATASVFGDIFLEDLRQYRENKLSELNLKGVFPLWKIPTGKLIREFIDTGFKAIITCVNKKYLDKSFAGRIIDNDFLRDLPPGVDPCGENGEFHTFVFDGPLFKKPVPFEKGEIISRKYAPAGQSGSTDHSDTGKDQPDPFDNEFWYCDLLPAQTVSQAYFTGGE